MLIKKEIEDETDKGSKVFKEKIESFAESFKDVI